MDLLFALIRLIHIVSAFTWFGLGVVSTMYILPATSAAGEGGFRFFRSLYTNTRFASAIASAAGITTLAGLIMYVPVFGVRGHFSTTGFIVLTIGALAGIVATIHGGAVTGRATNAYGKALQQYVADGKAIVADGTAALNQLHAKLIEHSRLSLILMLIALIGMASARYL